MYAMLTQKTYTNRALTLNVRWTSCIITQHHASYLHCSAINGRRVSHIASYLHSINGLHPIYTSASAINGRRVSLHSTMHPIYTVVLSMDVVYHYTSQCILYTLVLSMDLVHLYTSPCILSTL